VNIVCLWVISALEDRALGWTSGRDWCRSDSHVQTVYSTFHLIGVLVYFGGLSYVDHLFLRWSAASHVLVKRWCVLTKTIPFHKLTQQKHFMGYIPNSHSSLDTFLLLFSRGIWKT